MSDDIKRLKDEEKEIWVEIDDVKGDTAVSRSTCMSPCAVGQSWLGGLALISVGVLLFLSATTDFYLHNWWALFILIPAFSSLGNAWQNYRADGRFSKSVRGPFIGGLFILLVAAIFLFDWDWGKVWPLFLVIAGIGALLSSKSD
ncbi:MAG TPA: hypothetical protein ENK32_01790 [Anaerolineae bacterium]|nr:hypothetical protein [Anaerolineae bacterium]